MDYYEKWYASLCDDIFCLYNSCEHIGNEYLSEYKNSIDEAVQRICEIIIEKKVYNNNFTRTIESMQLNCSLYTLYVHPDYDKKIVNMYYKEIFGKNIYER